MVALLSGAYRLSYRQVCAVMDDLFGVRLSRGGIGRLRQEISDAVSPSVAAAKAYVQAQPMMHSDETSYPQGNRDGENPQRTKGWLWVLVTPLVSFFEVVLSRSQAAAKALIGEQFTGIVISDRYSAYRWIEVSRWQVCWVHLKPDFTAMAERRGVKPVGRLGQPSPPHPYFPIRNPRRMTHHPLNTSLYPLKIAGRQEG